jgi:hypothetical protein
MGKEIYSGLRNLSAGYFFVAEDENIFPTPNFIVKEFHLMWTITVEKIGSAKGGCVW